LCLLIWIKGSLGVRNHRVKNPEAQKRNERSTETPNKLFQPFIERPSSCVQLYHLIPVQSLAATILNESECRPLWSPISVSQKD